MVDRDLKTYYGQRAPEYERVYALPERQDELASLEAELPELLSGRHILEVACGTGYWTQVVARTAHSILATDIGEEVLAIARRKDYGNCEVRFAIADAFDLPEGERMFDGALVAFWWSHMLRQRVGEFMSGLYARLRPGARIVILDNAFAAGSSTPVSRTDQAGNQYQTRTLDDGSTFEVLKNFPSREDVESALPEGVEVARWRRLTYYWSLVCDVVGGDRG